MAYFKEIVTKAVVGKGKKSTISEHSLKPEEEVNTVLGCWIINHRFNGVLNGDDTYVNGSYDVNVWYSYDNDTKTDVASGTFTYSDKMNVPVVNHSSLSNNREVIVSSLSDPNVTEVKIDNGEIKFNVHKELGIEVVGDTKIRVNVDDNFDEYTDLGEDTVPDSIFEEIDNSINDEYLNNEEPNNEEDILKEEA